METYWWKRTGGNVRVETYGWKRTGGNVRVETCGWKRTGAGNSVTSMDIKKNFSTLNVGTEVHFGIIFTVPFTRVCSRRILHLVVTVIRAAVLVSVSTKWRVFVDNRDS